MTPQNLSLFSSFQYKWIDSLKTNGTRENSLQREELFCGAPGIKEITQLQTIVSKSKGPLFSTTMTHFSNFVLFIVTNTLNKLTEIIMDVEFVNNEKDVTCVICMHVLCQPM